MRRLALLMIATGLAACQPHAQNATVPDAMPEPVEAPPVAPAAPVAEPDPAPAAKPPAEKAPAMPPKASLPATPPKAEADYRSDLNLTGTEPFWGVQIRKDRITLTRPDHPDISTRNPGVEISGETASWNAGEMTITLKPARCSDGMSDREYPYGAQVKVGNEVLKGCGYNAKGLPRMPH
jgi:uncharacterized membrane protein